MRALKFMLAAPLLCSISCVTAFVSRLNAPVVQIQSRARIAFQPRGPVSLVPSVTAVPFQTPCTVSRTHGTVATKTRLYGVFGIGFGEIAIVLVIGAFLLGPEQIGKMIKSAATQASEVSKSVPKEFQRGLEEGENEARARVAKPMSKLEEALGAGDEESSKKD